MPMITSSHDVLTGSGFTLLLKTSKQTNKQLDRMYETLFSETGNKYNSLVLERGEKR